MGRMGTTAGAPEFGLARNPDRTQFRAGDALGERYRIQSHLGSGGMGEVYEVVHVELGRHFAAKVLRREHLVDGSLLSRFGREAKAMAQLRSDYVAQIVDSGRTADDVPYFVMELLDGTDLKALLRRTGSLVPGRATQLICDACWGLRAVHAAGLVHRDVKPANLFVTRRDLGEERCVLLDFGVTKSSSSAQTQEGQLVGTLLYMAPEQLNGNAVDARTDLYALGVVLYECLAGRPPHEGDSIERILYAIMNDDPMPLRRLRPEIPDGLAAIADRAIARKPDHRFRDASAMANALANYCRRSSHASLEATTSTTVVTLPPRVGSQRSRLAYRLLLAAVVLGSGIGGLAASPFVRELHLHPLSSHDPTTSLSVDTGGTMNPAASSQAGTVHAHMEGSGTQTRNDDNATKAGSHVSDNLPANVGTPTRKATPHKVQEFTLKRHPSIIDADNPYER